MFKDGTYISFDKAAYLLRKESQLRSGPCIILDNGVIIRDAVGVIENHKPIWVNIGSGKSTISCPLEHRGGMNSSWFKWCLNNECDTQPKEIGYKNDDESMRIRAKHMSQYILKKKNLVY